MADTWLSRFHSYYSLIPFVCSALAPRPPRLKSAAESSFQRHRPVFRRHRSAIVVLLSLSPATTNTKMKLPTILLSALLPLLALAQDGSIDGPTSSVQAAGYSCDASKCQLPNCNCASTSPPGGLQPVSFHASPINILRREPKP